MAQLTLVAANLIPLVGVIFLGWSAGVVLFIYWLETAIVGLYNIPRILFAAKGRRRFISKLFALPLFCVQFGMMLFVQGLIVVVLFNPGAEGIEALRAAAETTGEPTPQEEWAAYFGFEDGEELALEQLPLVLLYTVIITGSYWALLALLISHGVSFAVNYIGKGEFRQVTVDNLSKAPFQRVALLQIAVMIGGVFWLILGQPVVVLVMLVLMKIGLDLVAHQRERTRMAESAETPTIPKT